MIWEENPIIFGNTHNISPISNQLAEIRWGHFFWGEHPSQFNDPKKDTTYVSHEKKNLITFHYTGWLIGILIMVYYNPLYNPTNQGFFHCSCGFKTNTDSNFTHVTNPMRVIFCGKNWSLKITKLLEDCNLVIFENVSPRIHLQQLSAQLINMLLSPRGSIYSWWEIATYSRKTQVMLSMVFSFAQGLGVNMKDWNTRFSLGDVITLDQWSNA